MSEKQGPAPEEPDFTDLPFDEEKADRSFLDYSRHEVDAEFARAKAAGESFPNIGEDYVQTLDLAEKYRGQRDADREMIGRLRELLVEADRYLGFIEFTDGVPSTWPEPAVISSIRLRIALASPAEEKGEKHG
jgi:GTP1/Obg family GTP-binding protein